MTRARRPYVILLLPLVLLAGCGAGQDASDQGTRVTGSGPVRAVGAQADLRKVVYTADLTVRVGDAPRATSEAMEIARDADGIVFAQSSDLEGRRESRLTLKIPPQRFEPVMTALAGLGRAVERDIKADDVTEQVVDIEGRLLTATVSSDRLRSLLRDARSTADVVAVESELAKREAEIESLQGRLRVLNTKVDFATINLWLTERAALEVSRDLPGFLKALRAGWVALLNVVLAIVAVAGFLAPFAPFAAVTWWAATRLRRRRPHLPRPPRPPASPPTPPSGEGPSSPREPMPADAGA